MKSNFPKLTGFTNKYFLHFSLIVGLSFPILLLMFKSFENARPASDDYCAPAYNNVSTTFIGKIYWGYLNLGGRITNSIFFDFFQLFNVPELNFLSGRLSSIVLFGTLFLLSFTLSILTKSIPLAYGLVLAGIFAFTGSRDITVTSTWLTTGIGYTLILLTYGFCYFALTSKVSRSVWFFCVLVFALVNETSFILLFLASIGIYFKNRKLNVFFPIVISALVYLSSPGTYKKITFYESSIQELSVGMLLQKFVYSIQVLGFYVTSNFLTIICLVLIGMKVRVNPLTSKIGWISLGLLAQSITVVFFLQLTASPGYARALFLLPAGLFALSFGTYLSRKISPLGDKRKTNQILSSPRTTLLPLLLSFNMMLVSPSITSSIRELEYRALDWDKAASEIQKAKDEGLKNYAYPQIRSPFSEPNSYEPARNCASNWFGISLI